MKNIISTLLALSLILTLAACGESDVSPSVEITATTPVTTTPKATTTAMTTTTSSQTTTPKATTTEAPETTALPETAAPEVAPVPEYVPQEQPQNIPQYQPEQPQPAVSGYDYNNPIVAGALALVGSSGIRCTEVADAALNAVGKTLWVNTKTIYNYFNTVTGEKYEPHEIVINYSDYTYERQVNWWSIPDENGTSYGLQGVIIYYISNNIITNVELKMLDEYIPDKFKGLQPDDPDYINGFGNFRYSDMIGREMIRAGESFGMSALCEINIVDMGTQVSLNDIQPGDFLLYYRNADSPYPGHIAVYIGNNQAVHGGFDGDVRNVVISGMYMSGWQNPTAWRVVY